MSHTSTPPVNVLDQTLPTELQGVVAFEPATATNSQESTTMTTTPATLDTDAINKAVASSVATILADQNREKAVAEAIQKLTTDKVTAQASVTDLTSKLEATNATLATANTNLTKAQNDLAAKVTENTELTAKLATATKDLNTANASLATIASEKAVADRRGRIDKSELPETVKVKLRERAEAKRADGSFSFDDTTLNSLISDATDTFAAGKATTGTTAPGTPPANPANPADAAAQAAAKLAADQAAAVKAAAANTTTPTPPALDGGVAQALATAQLLAGVATTPAGMAFAADAFGMGPGNEVARPATK